MLNTRFGVEIEFTGITRKQAAEAANTVLNGEVSYIGTYYDTYGIKAIDGRTWKFMSDGSINTQKRSNGVTCAAPKLCSVELVTPILKYTEDITVLQEIIRALRKAGGFVNSSCGIHIHLDGKGHTAQSIKNFISIIYARNDLFYTALKINETRRYYCKELDEKLVGEIRAKKPTTIKELEDIWYDGYFGSRSTHYHNSRYHFLNLHSFFHGTHTVELRGFNSTLHAGEVRSYILLALALNEQALTQKCASTKKPQTENQKFAMRTYLNRIGFIGDDFKAPREHLLKNLSGSSAWRFGKAN